MGRTADLWSELIHAQADAGVDAVLVKYGVSPEITPLCGLDRVRSNGCWYEPDPDGVPAVIVPGIDFGEVVDLVAFQPHRPGHFKIRTGAAPFLGGDNMASNFGPLHIWRTPLGYLRAGLNGVVVLSWSTARPLLACCSEIIAEDVPHGDEVHEQLRRKPQMPKICVPTKTLQR